jgi:hypothetical protein
MSQALLNRRVADISVKDLQVLVETLVEKVLRGYELRPRKHFIDDEGWLCFRDERAYAEYLDKQERSPSEVKVVYSDEELLPETSIRLGEIHREIEAGASPIEHAELRKRLGMSCGIRGAKRLSLGSSASTMRSIGN